MKNALCARAVGAGGRGGNGGREEQAGICLLELASEKNHCIFAWANKNKRQCDWQSAREGAGAVLTVYLTYDVNVSAAVIV